ncbi:MAG: Asp-tRNA(Asn)/Glu-tRNA(Gln) amidotransferase subunit GatA [Candidatus Saganbacteria bacterium]|nr:Asp-tRNA(Asn)/Glu-tRNA(Gln) amidotransferase subunit GatA [Candidatus Saganbacteria bacterium]
MNLYNLTAHELSKKLSNKEIGCVELTESVYKRIETVEPKVNAFNILTKELALKKAKEVDDQTNREPQTMDQSLKGIPIAIKDNMCTDGIPTTCSSKILENYIPPYNATIVDLVFEAGMIPVGKTNLDEFAMGSSTENSAFKTTKNPWDLKKVPGGSSGGSAAAVAADETILSLGSDTGGSIRQPASFCGVVGLKPTYGRVSRYGLVAFASSLDQIGPITKDVTDAALLMNVIARHDPKDSTSVNIKAPDYTKSLVRNVKGLRLGLPKELFGEGIEENIKRSVMDAVKLLEGLGAFVREVSLPSLKFALAAYYIIAPAEASSNLARYDGVHYGLRSKKDKDIMEMYLNTRREGFGAEVKRRIMIGTYALSSGYYDAYYLKAQKIRTLIKNDFEEAFKDLDMIITPTSPTAAFGIGEKTADPLSMYLSDIATIPVNLAGLPAISIPCGYDNGLPIGLQMIGRAFDEETLFRAAYTFESETDYHKRKPPL